MVQGVALPGPKPDVMSNGGTAQVVVVVPHDLMSGLQIMPAILVFAKMSDQAHGVTTPTGRRHLFLGSVVAEEVQFRVSEQQRGITVRNLASEQGHGHDAPCDHGVDGDGPLQAFGRSEQQELGAALPT